MAEHRLTALPVDGHVHTQWSWDAQAGSMERSCARAVELGLPGIAFTEHVDHTVWRVALDDLDEDSHLASLASSDGLLTPPAFDAEGYLAEVERCRHLFPDLRILSGVELGEPHWHAAAVGGVLATGRFDRLLGSLHCLPDGDGFAEPPGLFQHRPAAEILRDYLAEITRLATDSDVFAVVAHIDYPIRHWPREEGSFDAAEFEEEFRTALQAIAGTGKALEINTVRPLDAAIARWWHEVGGQAVTFGSDAHEPDRIAQGFAAAAGMAEACGFRPTADPYAFWGRVG